LSADINLRHRTASGFLHHCVALDRIEVDADFFDGIDSLLLEQALRHLAVGADTGAVHQDARAIGHGIPFFSLLLLLLTLLVFRLLTSLSASPGPARR
jgi:hypothetical protein